MPLLGASSKMIWDPSDANPLHRRIPAEVVSRRPRVAKKAAVEKEKVVDEVSMDLKAAVALKPEARPKWLIKACKMVADGKASSTDLYDIIASRRFMSGLPDRISRRLIAIIKDSLDLFSDKQQRYLSSSDGWFVAQLSVAQETNGTGEDAEDPRAPIEKLQTAAQKRQQESAPIATGAPGQGRSKEESVAKWEVVEDEAARRRQVAAAEERARQEVARREDRARKFEAEEEAMKVQAAAAEAARKRKLEEEVDSMLQSALVPQPRSAHNADEAVRSRSISAARSGGSRSISSRTARRRLRNDRGSRPSWHSSVPPGGVLSGSRAIFLSRNFVEDLPHLPRPPTPGAQASRPRERSRSRSRSHGRSRKRRR